MSLFGAFDMEDDPIFGSHLRTMRQMNSMMNSLFADPFGMMGYPMGHRGIPSNALMSHSMPMLPNINRLLSGSLDDLGTSGFSSSSSTIVSMTSGPDGRPQIYKATSSTRCAPGGIKETQRTVSDSRTGTKKMAIGHHIGDRAHIIEKEQNMHTGDREEREELINLDDDEKEEFNTEWEVKARGSGARGDVHRIMGANRNNRHSYNGHVSSAIPAITAGPSRRSRERQSVVPPLVSARRNIRPSPLTTIINGSTVTKPYSPAGQAAVRKSKNIKTVSGSPPPADM